MSSLNFSCYFPPTGVDLGNCNFCHEDLRDGRRLMAHEGDGQKHPIHEECIINIARNWKWQCPNRCEGEINPPEILKAERVNQTVAARTYADMIARGVVRGVVTGFCLTYFWVKNDFISTNHAILVVSALTVIDVAGRLLRPF